MTREEERQARAARLVVRARGQGFVELAFENGRGEVLTSADGGKAALVLQYPQSGQIRGCPPIDEEVAAILTGTVESLNAALLRVAS
jgi:hypothetical protein